ncbi:MULTISPECIES: hypothetical protein [unclassified Streptomyces]|uniref:hypothetical protein n=1 Tax=unclassified Streptomyces TaxID=2593676 RepID=UPI000A7EEFA4|nr:MULTISPECIES: hypothetical protein [unclassified Streptomyces]
MARSSSGFVAGLTVAAVVAVGFLAYQASANAPDTLGTPEKATKSPAAGAEKTPGAKKERAVAVPKGSGTGERVVYALGDDRVWLVGAGDKVRRTFEVMPGTVDPAPGKYTVTSRTAAVTGSDGLPIEHVVLFTSAGGVPVGFSAAVNGSTAEPDATKKLGGIREGRADGSAMWEFAGVGRPVVVVQ